MVGGKVVGIARTEGEPTLLHVGGTRYKAEGGFIVDNTRDRICIKVQEGSDLIRVGDKVWWQGRHVFWTPQPLDGREDVKLRRASYSFVAPSEPEVSL